MTTVSDLFAALKRDRITAETGIGPQVLSRAAVDNIMPSGWYPAIRDLCAHDGLDCPEHLFRWTPTKPAADGAASEVVA